MNERAVATDAEQEASRWLVRLESPDVSLNDHRRFRDWLAASEDNRSAYAAVSGTWDKLDALKSLAASPSTKASPLPRRALLVGGSAAAATAAGTIGFWLAQPATTYAATLETGIGGRETARLADGSAIELNADSAVRIAFTEGARRATLERGEALFTVTGEDERPFQLRTRFGALTCRGASFLMKLTGSQARATVFSGQVQLADAQRPLIASSGREMLLGGEAAAIHEVSDEQSARRLAWREGMLSFDGDTLAEAAADVERQTGVRFRFASPEIAALRVGGYIDGRDAEAFVALVEANLGLSAERGNDGAVRFSS